MAMGSRVYPWEKHTTSVLVAPKHGPATISIPLIQLYFCLSGVATRQARAPRRALSVSRHAAGREELPGTEHPFVGAARIHHVENPELIAEEFLAGYGSVPVGIYLLEHLRGKKAARLTAGGE